VSLIVKWMLCWRYREPALCILSRVEIGEEIDKLLDHSVGCGPFASLVDTGLDVLPDRRCAMFWEKKVRSGVSWCEHVEDRRGVFQVDEASVLSSC
jgi:hypothetical protein